MKVGIIGAMVEEVTPLIEAFRGLGCPIAQENLGGNTYYKISVGANEVYIAYSKIGKVHAAITASVMIAHFGCEKILFSGVAGGLAKDLKVGDLLIASKLCQHDVDISAFGHPLGFIPESATFIAADAELNALAHKVAKLIGKELREGVIASGDQFIASESKKAWIIKEFGADAVEMEGASVAVVCNAFGVPFCVFRSISDSADGSADVSFDEFLESAAKISAQFTLQMLKALGYALEL
ncbi:5'-methylthioadenosine/adenosylhomocysteine nucleosidase [uncultured Helicobacter sp.]|uniref:5'-methylthioadenosine/adenosylhomocysteine nucleosidase n=1 Tax=uncultured Helicobacter sp. TaxID=175537 RepID=UPI0037512A7F